MLIFATVREKTPVRYLVFARHGAKDQDGNLTDEGHTQARALGIFLQNLHLGPFGKATYSPVARAADTAEEIMAILDPSCEVPAAANIHLFDNNIHKPEFVQLRNNLYKHIGEAPLAQFRQDDGPVAAMDELGTYIRTSIEADVFSKKLEGNFLAVGHGAYLNQGLYTLFKDKLTRKMWHEVLHGPCLDVATGYLIGVDEKLVPTDMCRFSWQEINLK